MSGLSDHIAAVGEACRRVNVLGRINAVANTVDAFLGVPRPPVSYPIRLDIVLTKACNLRCTFCIS